MRTVVGLYDRIDQARQAVKALTDAGFDRENINLVAADQKGEYAKFVNKNKDASAQGTEAGEGAATGAGVGAVIGGLGGLLVGLGALLIPGIGPLIAAGPIVATLAGAGIGAAAGGIVGALVGMGIPEEQAHAYAEGVKRGGTLVTVQTEDDQANRASSIMNQFNPVDIEKRASQWQQQDNWQGFNENAEPSKEVADIPATGGDFTIPVVNEEMDVTKREVQTGGVKVYAHVTEKPVSQDVNLREEHINVERRPVDRPATAQDQFVEGQTELTESHEEPVVRKESRVVEEVHVNKDVENKKQTVSDTVRQQQVEVQNINDNEWRTQQPRFQQHYQSQFSSGGMGYQSYEPAYRYGYSLARDPRYSSYDWNRLAPIARQQWENSNYGGSWIDLENAVRYGWEQGRQG